MTRPTDVAERIARLERLLDQLEQQRHGGRSGSAPEDAPGPDDGLREVIAMLQERLGERAIDDGDTIAMRALLEQYRSMTAELRAQAAGVDQRLDQLAALVMQGHKSLKALEEL